MKAKLDARLEEMRREKERQELENMNYYNQSMNEKVYFKNVKPSTKIIWIQEKK